MKRIFSAAMAATLTLGAASYAGALAADDMGDMSMSSATAASVKLTAQNGSGENGTVKLAQTGDNVTVTLTISHAAGPQPAHIHTGSCANLGGVKYPLTNVVDGKSTTVIKDVKLTSIETGDFAINVHKSTTDLKDYVSCGAIAKVGDMKM